MAHAFVSFAASFFAVAAALSLDVSETPGVASSPHMYGVMFEASLPEPNNDLRPLMPPFVLLTWMFRISTTRETVACTPNLSVTGHSKAPRQSARLRQWGAPGSPSRQTSLYLQLCPAR